MHMYKRAVLYLARKKGKAALLFLIFFLVFCPSADLLFRSERTGQAARTYVPISALPFPSGPTRR